MLYPPLQLGLPPARGAELATIQKDVTALQSLHPLPVPLRHNILNLLSPHEFFQAPNAPKPVFGRGSAHTPLGELTTLPQTP